MNMVVEAKQSTQMVSPTPADLLAMAIQKGADMDQLERLMGLKERYDAGEARKEFTAAMTKLKAQNLTVSKDKSVSFSGTHYTHASLAQVVETVVGHMADVGLSHRWTINQEGRSISVSCIVTHERGHSEVVTMTASPDDSGKKNAIQQVASTVTYLQRYTLMSACGLASRDMPDDDGRGYEERTSSAPVAKVSDDQRAELADLIRSTRTDAAEFLKWLNAGATELSEVPAVHFRRAKAKLEAKAEKLAKEEAANGLAA